MKEGLLLLQLEIITNIVVGEEIKMLQYGRTAWEGQRKFNQRS